MIDEGIGWTTLVIRINISTCILVFPNKPWPSSVGLMVAKSLTGCNTGKRNSELPRPKGRGIY
jgi:hypothetical protein